MRLLSHSYICKRLVPTTGEPVMVEMLKLGHGPLPRGRKVFSCQSRFCKRTAAPQLSDDSHLCMAGRAAICSSDGK